MNNQLPVLIVGAGPTGLVMACELAKRGIAFRIIDKKPQPTASSNATWIQTLTIELFDLMGIAPRFIKLGNPCQAINIYSDGKSLGKLPLDNIDSTYPFILMLPQKETEKILNEYLQEFNVKVERGLELINIKQQDGIVTSTIQHANGKNETITSNWLIACDGANSTVREKCKIEFLGEDLPEQFIVADAKIDSFMSKNEIHAFFDQGRLFSAFPLGNNHYRITANLNLPYKRKIFTEKEVIELAQERAHGEYYVKNVSWISPFWIHGKVAHQMRHDNIFLAGDAAHIHSPAGGQGMNTGIQDAYNLAWKLALFIHGKAQPMILDTYHSERYPIVKEIVNQNDHFTKMALFDDGFLNTLNQFMNKINHHHERFAKKISEQITQLKIEYKESPIIDYENISGKSIQQGTRAPDVNIDASTRLYDYLRNTNHNILLFSGLTPNKSKLEKLSALHHFLTQKYSDSITTHIIQKETYIQAKNSILDSDEKLHAHYYAKNPVVYIIRPDNYIAYCSKSLDPKLIEEFLKRYLY